MKNSVAFTARCWLLIVGALAVGILSVAPQFLALWSIGDQYRGSPFLFLDNEETYLARIRELTEGKWGLGSPFLHEYKANPAPVLPFGEYFYALPVILFDIDLSDIVVASKFILPAVFFVLVYLLAVRVAGSQSFPSRINAASIGFAVTLAYDLVDYRTAWSLVTGLNPATHLLLWTRLVNPVIGGILLFLVLHFLWTVVRHDRWVPAISASILLATMPFYFFSWVIAVCTTAACGAVLMLWREKQRALKVFTALVIAFILQIPLMQRLAFLDRAAAMRNGMFFTHTPVVNKLLLVTVLIFVVSLIAFYVQDRAGQRAATEKQWWILFASSLLLGGIVAMNQQVVTGRTVWPYHFVQYTIPLSMFIILIALYHVVLRWRRGTWYAIAFLVMFASLFFGAHSAISYTHNLDKFRDLQRYAGVLSWLEQNGGNDCVVLGNDSQLLDRLVPAYTHCDVYTTEYTFFGVPAERIRHNYLVTLRLRGIDPREMESYLRSRVLEVNSIFFEDWNQLFSEEPDERVERVIKQLASEYTDFVKKDFLTELKRFRVDFIVSEGEFNGREMQLPVRLIESFSGIHLYKL